jgi:uncharacterized protein DUF6551
MADDFRKFTIQWIPIKSLSIVWPQAQRALDTKFAQLIADNFNPDLFGVVSVTLPNGNGIYHCIDGWHRVNGAKHCYGENEKVPCNVFEIDNPRDAAKMFVQLNKTRKAQSPVSLFKTQVTAGDETCVAVNRIILNCGFRVESHAADGTIRAVNACVSVYKRFGSLALTEALTCIWKTWGRDSNAVDSALIGGFGELCAAHPRHIDMKRLGERVSKKWTPGRLLGAAKAGRQLEGGTLANSVRKILTQIYDAGLRAGQRLADHEPPEHEEAGHSGFGATTNESRRTA